MKYSLFLLLVMSFNFSSAQKDDLPDGFVYIQEEIPGVVLEMRYAGRNNFIGKKIKGYKKPVAIISDPAASALKKVQQEVSRDGFCLKIFDAYRPQRAVDHFLAWSRNEKDTLKKQEFYPDIGKEDLFRLGYIASRSGHTRGSTIDLTLTNCQTGEEVDMGGPYDFFGELSHHDASEVTPEQKRNREYLKEVMIKYGFNSYSEEWWHYTLRNEPYPDRYFNFVVQ